MARYATVLFDLDGTLTDPWVGITSSVQYALDAFDIHEPLEALTPFIGPPLYESFQTRYGFNEQDTMRAIDLYRERFSTQGIFENDVFEGIEPLLQKLKDAACTLAVATAKPENYAVEILDHYGLSPYFDAIAGSRMDVPLMKKADIIEDALARMGNPDRATCVMVGDRKFDIIGARAVGIDSIAVEWGYAPVGELDAVKPDLRVSTIAELAELLLSGRIASHKGRD